MHKQQQRQGARVRQRTDPCNGARMASAVPAAGFHTADSSLRRVPWLLRPLALALVESVSAVQVTLAAACSLVIEVRALQLYVHVAVPCYSLV